MVELFLGMFLFVGFLAVTIGVAAVPPYFILKPLMLAMRDVPPPSQFRLCDLFCLIVMIQIALALLGPILRGADVAPEAAGLVVTIALVNVLFLWLSSLKALTLAGIESSGRRSAFQVVVVPGTLAMTVGGVIALWSTVFSVGGLRLMEDNVPAALAVMFSLPLCCIVCYILKRLTQWTVAGAGREAMAGN